MTVLFAKPNTTGSLRPLAYIRVDRNEPVAASKNRSALNLSVETATLIASNLAKRGYRTSVR